MIHGVPFSRPTEILVSSAAGGRTSSSRCRPRAATTVREIVQVCKNTGRASRSSRSHAPPGRKVHVSDLSSAGRDLLGREPAELDLNLISSYLRGSAFS